MKISFDLDGTLIPTGADDFPLIPQKHWQKLLGLEHLRKGTQETFELLRKKGYQVGIYTTSFRTEKAIRFWLRSYGLKVDFIVNELKSIRKLSQLGISASKYPRAFQIDMHWDDQQGVIIEGLEYGFEARLLPAGPIQPEFILSSIEKESLVNH